MTSPLLLNGRTYPLERLAEILTVSAGADLDDYERRVLSFCQRWLAGESAFLVQTSGSTGQPKPIVLSRTRLVASARLTGNTLDLQPGDRALACLSCDHIAGLMMLVRGLELGLALTVVTPRRDPLADLPPDVGFEFAAFVPLQLQTLLALPARRAVLDRMRAILVGGAAVSAALQAQVQTLTAPVYHSYGMTETVSHIALRRLNGPAADDGFRPLAGVTITQNQQDCLVVRAAVTDGQPLVTRDRIELRADGSFRFLGRVDNIINSGGFKVQAEQVEAALEQVLWSEPTLAGCRLLVVPLPDAEFGQTVAALIEGPPLSAERLERLRARLREAGLHEYTIPRHFHFRPRLLETPTGKLDRWANLAALAAT